MSAAIGRLHALYSVDPFAINGGFVKFPLTTLLAALLIVPACNRNEPRSTQAAPEERSSAVTAQMKDERDAYVKNVDAQLAEFDQKVDGLNERAGAMTGAAKTDFKNAIDSLRDQRKTVDSKLDDLKKVNVESWMTLKGEVDSALASLDRSYMQVSNTYEKAPTSTTPKAKTY
jgi:predicted negative regulator of RcsB-dependent stress response